MRASVLAATICAFWTLLIAGPLGEGVASAEPDRDLAARFSLAAGSSAPAVRFTQLPASGAAAIDAIKAPDCTRPAGPGLCDINWGSAPPAAATIIDARALDGAEILLRTERGLPLVAVRSGEVLLAIDLSDPDSPAAPGSRIRRWPYFNYLLHVAACRTASIAPSRFADWEHAPLPGAQARTVTFAIGLALWCIALLLFRRARRGTPGDRDASAAFLAFISTSESHHTDGATASVWSRAGFTRPLSGLLTLIGSMVLLIGPYFALQWLLSAHVQPFPEAGGYFSTVVDALFIAWLTFDLGTQTAMVKYFAEHRAVDPAEALRDVQFYFWWQIGSRLVEATLLGALALGYLPVSSYALYAPMVLLYAAGCPGNTATLPKLVCQALQRFDYQNLLDLIEARLLSFLVPMPMILLGRAWGRSHPRFGEAYGAAIGLGLGQLVTQILVLTIGLLVLRKLRVPLRPLFLAGFTRQTAKRQLWFGWKLTLGQEPLRLTSLLESMIILRWLRDFPTWLGIRDLLHNRLTFLFFFAWGYYQSAVPAVAEAFARGRKKLVTYYVARYLQFGFLYSALMFGLLCAIGPRYIAVALGAQWIRAADYLVLASLSGLLLPLAWLSDSLQQGAGRPGLTTTVMFIEQGLKLLLLLLFVRSLQFTGLYVALLLALSLKCAIGFGLSHRYILRLTLPIWSTVGAPLAAGLLNFAIWRAVIAIVDPATTASVLALFLLAGAGSFVCGLFLCGLLGGLDETALQELTDAARVSAIVGPVCRVLAAAARLGARLAPFRAPPHPLARAAYDEPEAPVGG